MHVDKLDDIVITYNNTYHGTIKIKPFYVNLSMCINSNKEINDKEHKFKIGDFVRTSK